MDSAQQHEHRIQQHQHQQQQQQHYQQQQDSMPPVSSSSLQPIPPLPPPPARSSSGGGGSNSIMHNETSDHHSSFLLHRDHHKNENIAMSSSDFKGGGGELTRDSGIIVNNIRGDQGMNCDRSGRNNNEGNNKVDHNNTQRTDDHHDNKNSSSNNNKSDILLYSNDYNSSRNNNSNNINSNNASINCDHIETTKLSIDLDKTITKSIILRQNSSSASDSSSVSNHHNEMKSKMQHSNTSNENHMGYQQQQAAYHHYHHQQQQQHQQQQHQQLQHQQQQQHYQHQQQQHHQHRAINPLYVNNPDFSKPLQTTSSTSSSPSLVKMKPPDFSKIIVNNKSNDLQISNPDFSKIGSTSSSPGEYKPDRPVVTQTNFAEMSKKYNFISDLQLKKPIESTGRSPSNTPNQTPPYPNLYVKAPDFSATKIQTKLYPEQQHAQHQHSSIQKPTLQSQPPPTSSSSQYDCEPTAHVIHKYPYINNVPQRTNPPPQSSGSEYPPPLSSQQQYDREQINRMDHERKQEEFYRKQYAHYYSKQSQQPPPKQQPPPLHQQQQQQQTQLQQQPAPSAPAERYYQQDYKPAHPPQPVYNQQKYYGHPQYQPPQTNVIQQTIANQYSKSGQSSSPYHHYSPQVQSKPQSSGLMNPPQNWPSTSTSKVDASRSPIIHQPSPTHHQNISSPVNSYKSTPSPHSNVPSPKMSNSPFAGYSASPNSSNVMGNSVPIKYENYPPPQLKQHHATVDYVDLTAARKKSETNLKFHPKFASTGTLNANHSNTNMDVTNLTRSVDSSRYGQYTAYPETRHSSVDINYYNKALHPDVSIRVSDDKLNQSYQHQYPQSTSATSRSNSMEANLNKEYYQSGHPPTQRVEPQMHPSQSVKYPSKSSGQVGPPQSQSQMMVHDNYSRPSAVANQVPQAMDHYMKGRPYPAQSQPPPQQPVKIDRPRPSETVTSRSGIKYNEMYPTNSSIIQHNQSQPTVQQPQPQVVQPAPPVTQTKIVQPSSSSVVSSTTKKDLSSPLDLSVKTIKTKADSTGDDLKIMPTNSALKVDFHPNFSKHGIGAYNQDQRSSSSAAASTSRVVGPQPNPNVTTFYSKKSDTYLTNTPQHHSKAVDVPYNNTASASSSSARPVIDQSNYVSKKSMAKTYPSQANQNVPQPQYPPPVPEKKYSATQPPVIVNTRVDKGSPEYQQNRRFVENILKRNMSINPFSYSGSFNHTSKKTVDPKSNETGGIYSTTTSSQSHRKRAAEPLPHEASLPPVKHSRSDHPQKTVTEVYENLLESMNKNKENPYQQRGLYPGPNTYQPTQPHPQHLAPQQPPVAQSNRYQYPYPTKESSTSSGQKQSHQVFYQTSSEYQNAQPKTYLPTTQEAPMRTKESTYQYPAYQQQPDRYYPNHHPPNHKIVEPIPQTPTRHTDYYNHPPQHQPSQHQPPPPPPVQPQHPQPATTLSHTHSTTSFQVIHPTNHNREVTPENHIIQPLVTPYAHPIGYHRQHADQAIRTLETNLKIIENHTAPVNGNSNPVLLPSPKGADQTVISKLRTSLEMKEIEKQKLLRKSSLEMIAPITNNHVIKNASPVQQTPPPLVTPERTEVENLETESTNDSRRSNEMNSILAARIRTKGELKGFIPIPAIQPPPLNSVITRNGDLDLDNENSRLSNKTLEPTSDMEGVAKFDLIDWEKACNNFVAELQTGEPRIKKPVRIRRPNKPKPISVSPKLETVQKEVELIETTSNIVDVENQVDIIKSENKDFSSMVAKISDKSSSSSDEDKPLYYLKQSQESSNTIKKETTMNDDDSQSSMNKSKRSSVNDRSSKEKQRLERERRLAARLGSSSSDSETDAQKVRLRKRIRKPKSRMSIAMKSRTSVESSEDDKPIKPKTESAPPHMSETTPGDTKLESSDSEPISTPRKKSLRVVSENDDTEMAEIIVKKEEEIVTPVPVTPVPETTPTPKEPESKRIVTTRTSRSSTRNSISNQDEETPKKEGDDPEKTLVTPKTKAIPKKVPTSGAKSNTKLSPPVAIPRVTETPSPPEETMTRSKRKREIEQQLSNSKILRNDKVVKNIQFEARAKVNKLPPVVDPKTSKNVTPPQSTSSCGSNPKPKKIDELKRKTMESEGEVDLAKPIAKNKKSRRGSKVHKSCSSSSSERASSPSSSEPNESGHEHGVAERLRPRKAKNNSVGEEKAKPTGQTKTSPGADTKGKSAAKDDKSVAQCKTSKSSPVKKAIKPEPSPKTEPSVSPTVDAPKNGITEDPNRKFHPGWEEEFYQYKRALKVPPSLISIRHRISTSLPDLDHSSDASECFSVCSGDKTPRPQQKHSVETQTIGSRLPNRKTASLNSTPIPTPPPIIKIELPEMPLKSKSIIELLHQRVSRPPIKPKRLTKTNQEPKLLPRTTESELLDTPGAANESIFGRHKLFETPVLKSRTRTEHRVLKTKEIIREVFGGEDRPASAPPLGQDPTSENESTECLTFDQKYSQYLQKINVDFIDRINAKARLKPAEEQRTELAIKQECEESPILAEALIKQEPPEIQEPPTCDTLSNTSERNTVTPVLFQTLVKAKKKGNRSARRKGSSGFDYIRKKKKPTSSQNAGTSQAEIQSEINKKKKLAAMHEKLLQEKDENDVCREIRGWVLNKGVGESVLHKAARLGYIDTIAYCLIRMEMDPDPKDNAGYTPLHEASSRGHLEIARLLLQYGANPSSTAQSGIRPLHEAIENNYIEIVRLLLSYGADPLLATYSGQTPLMLSESEEMTNFLKNHLYDIQNTSPLKSSWKFNGPWCRFDPDTEGYEVLADAPASDPENILFEPETTPVKENGIVQIPTVEPRIEIKSEFSESNTIMVDNNGTIVSTSSVIMNSTVVLPSKLNKNKNCTAILNSLCSPGVKKESLLTSSNDNNNNNDDDTAAIDDEGKENDECDNLAIMSGDDLFEIEESENPLPPLYLLKDEGTDKWVLLQDLCNLLKVKSKDTLLKQICPTSPPSICNKELLRELKMSDFLEKATCLQLLCAGEKLNIRASKVVLVRYNDSVRTLLGVKTIMMTM